LLDRYWRSSQVEPAERKELQSLARDIIEEPEVSNPG